MVRTLIIALALLVPGLAVGQEVLYPAGTPGVVHFDTNGRQLEEIDRAFRALEERYENGSSIRDFVVSYAKVPDHPPTIAFMRIGSPASPAADGSVVITSPGPFYQVVVDGDDVTVTRRD